MPLVHADVVRLQELDLEFFEQLGDGFGSCEGGCTER
jgi:hypothetical protein